MSLLETQTTERRSGRSTRIAIKFLILVIEQAGTPVQINDHTGSHAEARRVMYMVSDMLTTLGIPHLKDADMRAIKVYPIKERKE
jgi:hypothetical protein